MKNITVCTACWRAKALPTFQIATAGLALYLVIKLLVWQQCHYHALPVYDDIFDHLKLYRADGIGGLLVYLFSSHNEHHITTTRIFTTLDTFLFGGRLHLQAAVANITQLAGAIVAYRLYIAGTAASALERSWIFSLLALFFLNASYLTDFTLGLNLEHFLMGLLCILSALTLMRVDENRQLNKPVGNQFAVLLVLATLATLTLGSAPVITLAATAIAIILHWPRRWIGGLAAIAILHVGLMQYLLYIKGLHATVSHDIVGIVKFAAVYLGGPFIRLVAWPSNDLAWWHSGLVAALLGSGLLFTAALMTVQRLRKPNWGGKLAAFGLALMIMIIITALAAGYKRLNLGLPEAANKKYASMAALAWLGWLMAAIGVMRQWRGGRYQHAPAVAVMIVMLPFAAMGLSREGQIWQKWIDRNWEVAMAVFNGVDSRDFLQGIYWPGEEFRDYLRLAEEKKKAIFSYYDFVYGDDLSRALDGRKETDCYGAIEVRVPAPESYDPRMMDKPGKSSLVTGWAWIVGAHRPARDIVMVDADNKIIGTAHATRPSAQANERLALAIPTHAGWLGFVRQITPGKVTFYALSGPSWNPLSKSTYCKLGTLD